MNWIKIFDREILQEGDFIRSAKAGGKRLCIVKSGSEIYATQRYCPHAGADLSGGWCLEGKLVCPYHRHEFNLTNGKGAAGQGNYLNTYPIEVREDGVYAGLPEPGFFKRLFGSGNK